MTDVHPAPVLGIIGGSGLYDLEGLEDIHWQQVKSPWGDPSDELLRGRLDGVQMIFLSPTMPGQKNHLYTVESTTK